jgi:hypothetical protein
MTEQTAENALKIAALNDNFRQTFRGGKIALTEGVQDLSVEDRLHLFTAVRGHDTFEPDNDPYGEHDFGTIELNEEKYFFKIDYYDSEMEMGSEDPADPTVTTRLMTLMRADEY